MTIAELALSGKKLVSAVPQPWLLIGIVILSSSASFGLGILEGRESGTGSGLSISELATTTPPAGVRTAGSALQAAAAASGAPQPVAAVPSTLPAGGQVVASKSGAKYYLPWCGGAKLIKDANKVWFASREAAEAAGYQPAANCKGL